MLFFLLGRWFERTSKRAQLWLRLQAFHGLEREVVGQLTCKNESSHITSNTPDVENISTA